jgi:hypothetical protein
VYYVYNDKVDNLRLVVLPAAKDLIQYLEISLRSIGGQSAEQMRFPQSATYTFQKAEVGYYILTIGTPPNKHLPENLRGSVVDVLVSDGSYNLLVSNKTVLWTLSKELPRTQFEIETSMKYSRPSYLVEVMDCEGESKLAAYDSPDLGKADIAAKSLFHSHNGRRIFVFESVHDSVFLELEMNKAGPDGNLFSVRYH